MIDRDRVILGAMTPGEILAELARLRDENEQVKADVAKIVDVAHAAGWNGVENSKILAVFLKGEFAELARLRTATDPAFVAWARECQPDIASEVEFCEARGLSRRGADARRKLAAIDAFLAAIEQPEDAS